MQLTKKKEFRYLIPSWRRMKSISLNKLLFIFLWIASLYGIYFYSSNRTIVSEKQVSHQNYVKESKEADGLHYDKDMPLIFVGGMPRSGTTLMRTMLDAHPQIRCGQETRVIPRILGLKASWYKSSKERIRLKEAGVSEDVINSAITQFILEIIVRHGKPAPYLCNKDPFTLKSMEYLHVLFPNSKFIFMVRDGRATTHSIISRKVTISGFNVQSYRDVITKWSNAMAAMHQQCVNVGPSVCLMVRYEKLVLHPMAETKRLMSFLGIPWDESMLNHEKHLDNISLSSVERSTDQVQKPLYLSALTSWFGKFPEDVERDLPKIAPMLQKLGYDPTNMRPSYGTPDEFVLNKTKTFNNQV